MSKEKQGSSSINRRKFLKYSGAAGLGLLLGAGGWRIGSNETQTIEPFGLDVLLPMALNALAGKLPQFGTHPDLETPSADPWADLDWVKERVGREDYIGAFSTIENLYLPEKRTELLRTLDSIARRGTEAVVGIGYGRKVQGYHPFDSRVRTLRRQDARHTMQTLESIGAPVTARIFFEMNESTYTYGKGRELSDEDHVTGYKEAFAEFAAARSTNSQVKLSFNPSVQNFYKPGSFSEYWPVVDGQVLADSAGIDAYHLYPGARHFFHPHYWYPGQYSPETALLPSFWALNELTQGQVPWMVWEIGSLAKDAEWLSHALLLTYAAGGQGIMHFNYDKTAARLWYEGDWRMNDSIAAGYQTTLQRVGTGEIESR